MNGMTNPVLGIDLGTTNSVVAVAEEGTVRVLADEEVEGGRRDARPQVPQVAQVVQLVQLIGEERVAPKVVVLVRGADAPDARL